MRDEKVYETILGNAMALAEMKYGAPLEPKVVERCEALAEMQSGGNPLSAMELVTLAKRHPDRYGFLTEQAL
jgi:hypothetical protein